MPTKAEEEARKQIVRRTFESLRVLCGDRIVTDEDLLYHPDPEAKEFVRLVNQALGETLTSSEIMVLLMRDRKKGAAPSGKKRKGVRLEPRLAALGLKLTRDQFHGVIAQVFRTYRTDGQAEKLLMDFDQSPKFCEDVRNHSEVVCPELPNEIILRTLQNWRKTQRKFLPDDSPSPDHAVVPVKTGSGKMKSQSMFPK